VSTPLTWDEVEGSDPAAFTIATVPHRYADIGDPWAGMDDEAGSLEALLRLAGEQEAAGMGDAPWPPHYEKGADEPPRVQPSKRRKTTVPVVEIARAKTKDEALEALERWKTRHPDVVAHLEPADVLVDAMRGRFTTWTRVRVRLSNVPANLRPEQEPLEVDYDPRVEWQR
jgi:hypothetical protein